MDEIEKDAHPSEEQRAGLESAPEMHEGWMSCPRGCGRPLRSDTAMETTSHVCY